MGGRNPYRAPRADLPASADDRPSRPGRQAAAGLALGVAHMLYATLVGWAIYARPGTRAWVNLAWLPGCLVMSRAGGLSDQPLIVAGFWLALLGSAGAGWLGRRAVFGPGRGASTWAARLLWLAWVPVPYPWTPFYWFESY